MIISPAKRWGVADALLCLLLAVAAALLLQKATAALNYHWNWLSPLRYLFSRGEDGGWRAGLLWEGFAMSVRLFIIGGILSILIAAPVALAALSPDPVLRAMSRLYVESLRHLPPIVFMFVFFFFISSQLLDGDWSRPVIALLGDSAVFRFLLGPPERMENMLSGALCLALFEAAFFAEILRAGVLSVERGQWDAARALGLSSRQVFRLVILPQVLSRVAAPLTGQSILLIKDSAILSVISVQELTFSAQETAVSTQQVFETWILAAALYFTLCWPLLLLSRRLETRAPD